MQEWNVLLGHTVCDGLSPLWLCLEPLFVGGAKMVTKACVNVSYVINLFTQLLLKLSSRWPDWQLCDEAHLKLHAKCASRSEWSKFVYEKLHCPFLYVCALYINIYIYIYIYIFIYLFFSFYLCLVYEDPHSREDPIACYTGDKTFRPLCFYQI